MKLVFEIRKEDTSSQQYNSQLDPYLDNKEIVRFDDRLKRSGLSVEENHLFNFPNMII